MSIIIRAHGKLLITGEYAVLDGAEALALPVRYGQTLRAYPAETPARLHWVSTDHQGQVWFEAFVALPTLEVLYATDMPTAERLRSLLRACQQQQPHFLADATGWAVRMEADYPLHWGLGSSSTLIAALARWAEADPYVVLFETLGGSGYDIACAFAEGPIFYQLLDRTPRTTPAPFHPPFADHLFFVFLGKKQDSRAEIRRFRQREAPAPEWLNAVSALAHECASAPSLEVFAQLLRQHEQLISAALGVSPVQEVLFADFPGVVKSLGAWGGDFALAASPLTPSEIKQYFEQRGFGCCIAYREMAV